MQKRNTSRTFSVLAADQIANDSTSWVEVMPTAEKARNGRFYFTMTSEDLQAVAKFIEANPEKIPVDRDHSGAEVSGDTRAAGWFTGQSKVVGVGDKNPAGQVQAHESAWAEVKWTPSAVEEIRGGDYRFMSPEWHFKTKDPKTGLMTGFDSLAASTLTNRPFFTDLAPVTVSKLTELLNAATAADEPAVVASLKELRANGVTSRPGVEDLAEAIKAATADGQTLTLDPDDMVVLQAMDDLLDEILGEPESEDAAQAQALVTVAADSKEPYGNVDYADPGMQKDGMKRYPLDSEAHCRAAWSYINMPKNAAKYSSGDLAKVKSKIQAALAKFTKKTTSTSASEEDTMDSEVLKALGLKEDASTEEALAAAVEMREKLAITEGFDRSVLEQLAKTTASEIQKDRQLAQLQRDTAAKNHERDRDDLLAKAVEFGQILPVHKPALKAVYDATTDGPEKVKAIIDATPKKTWNEHGSGGEGLSEQPVVREYRDKKGNLMATSVDDGWLDRTAQGILAEKGKTLKSATAAEYTEALEQARTLATRG